MRRRARRRALAHFAVTVAVGSAAALAVPGCQTTERLGGGPIVREQRVAPNGDALRRLAVIPFYPAESLRPPDNIPPSRQKPLSRWDIATLVGNFFADALSAHGVGAIPPSDVEIAFTGDGHPVPRVDPRAAAELSSRSFGATGVILGRVMRFREREGGSAGATRPASVAFEVSLYDVQTGRRLWRARFDETQQSVTANVLRARQYPGGGTRWLSASEFTRWGSDMVVRQLLGTGSS